MIILPCFPAILAGGYMTYVFLLLFVFGLLLKLVRG